MKFPQIHRIVPYVKNQYPPGFYDVLLTQKYIFGSDSRISIAVDCLNSSPFTIDKVIPRQTAHLLSQCDRFYFGNGHIKGDLKKSTISKLPIMPVSSELSDKFKELMEIKKEPSEPMLPCNIDLSQIGKIQEIFKPTKGVFVSYVRKFDCIRVEIQKDAAFTGTAIIKPFRIGISNFL